MKNSGPPIGHAQRQLDVVVGLAVEEIAPGGKTAVINRRIDAVARRGRRQHIGNEAFIPAADFMIHGPAVIRTPVPVQQAALFLGKPVPFDFLPQPVGTPAQLRLGGRVGVEVLACTQQTHAQEGGFNQIGRIVLAEKGNRGPGAPVQEVRARRRDSRSHASGHPAWRRCGSTAAARVIQPRSTATMMHIRPKPVPPVATRSSAGASPGGAPVGGQAADRVPAFPEEAEGLSRQSKSSHRRNRRDCARFRLHTL